MASNNIHARLSTLFQSLFALSCSEILLRGLLILVSLEFIVFELFYRLLVSHLLENLILDLFFFNLGDFENVRLKLRNLLFVSGVCYPHCNLVKLRLEVHDDTGNDSLGQLLSNHCKEKILPVLGTMALWHLEGESSSLLKLFVFPHWFDAFDKDVQIGTVWHRSWSSHVLVHHPEVLHGSEGSDLLELSWIEAFLLLLMEGLLSDQSPKAVFFLETSLLSLGQFCLILQFLLWGINQLLIASRLILRFISLRKITFHFM